MTPSCPWCSKRTSVDRLPRAIASKEWICTDCDVVFSGTESEHYESRFQRALVKSIRESRESTPPTQQELTTDA